MRRCDFLRWLHFIFLSAGVVIASQAATEQLPRLDSGLVKRWIRNKRYHVSHASSHKKSIGNSSSSHKSNRPSKSISDGGNSSSAPPLAPAVASWSLLRHVSVLMVADKGSLRQLFAAQCSYMQTLDPAQVVYVSDFELPASGACGLAMPRKLRVNFAVDYFEICRKLFSSQTPLHPWVLVVKPWTFVNTKQLNTYLDERGPKNPEVYVGHVRNATSELTALAQMPHVAYEYGILIRSWALTLIGRDKEEYRSYLSGMRGDFHSVELAVSDIAATLFASPGRVNPTQRQDLFAACPPSFDAALGLDSSNATSSLSTLATKQAVALSPLEPLQMLALADSFGFFGVTGGQGAHQQPKTSYAYMYSEWERAVEEAQATQQQLSPPASFGKAASAGAASAGAASLPHRRGGGGGSNERPRALEMLKPATARQAATRLAAVAGNSSRSSSRRALALEAAPHLNIARSGGGGGAGNGGANEVRVLYAMLAREDSVDRVVGDAMATWAAGQAFLKSGASVLFFYSQLEWDRMDEAVDARIRKGLSEVIARLSRLKQLKGSDEQTAGGGGGGAKKKQGERSAGQVRKFHKKSQDYRYKYDAPGAASTRRATGAAAAAAAAGAGGLAHAEAATKRQGDIGSSVVYKVAAGIPLPPPSPSSSAVSAGQSRRTSVRLNPFDQSSTVSDPVWLSENLAPLKTDGGSGGGGASSAGPLAQVRLVGLSLPPMPKSSSSFYRNSMSKPRGWDVWLRKKVALMTRFMTTFKPDKRDPGMSLESYAWFVVVDDDTYIKVPAFLNALRAHDHRQPTAVGRKFFNDVKGWSLLGGGPGIALSKGAVRSMAEANCLEKSFPINSHTVPGGDGWLGQCMNEAGVLLEHDWRFKSLPPFAFSQNQRDHAVSFHKSSVHEVHSYLNGQGDSAVAQSPQCKPVLLRDSGQVLCLPHFTIIGAQKAGTTSLFKYLGQHPQVRLPKEKEANFYGNPWPLKTRLKKLTSFTFDYLPKFSLSKPSDARKMVVGEASPDYFVSTLTVLPNLLRFVPSMKIIVSLRDPVDRFVSAYKNKVADGTVHKHLDESLYHGKVDSRLDDAVGSYRVPSISDLARRVNSTLQGCPDYAMHYTLAEKPPGGVVSKGRVSSPLATLRRACYVNPFVLHGYYAKYLRPYYDTYGGRDRGNLKVVDFARIEGDAANVMQEIGTFLSLDQFNFSTAEVFNSRKNRGVHAAGSGKRGGDITGVSKDKLGKLDAWGETLGLPVASLLRRYFQPCNAELKGLLAPEEQMSWT